MRTRSMIQRVRPCRQLACLFLAVTLLAGCLSGCGDFNLLEVDAPNRVLPETLQHPSRAQLLVTSVQATFECAFGAYIVTMGLVGDELVDAQSAQAIVPYDQRNVRPEEGLFGTYARADCFGSGTEGLGVWTPVNSARWYADFVVGHLEGWSDAEVANRMSLLATTLAYGGYSLVLMGEGFCSAVIDGGPELSPAQVLMEAEQRFSRAIEAARAAGNQEILNMALVGRARARLNLGRNTEAAEDARQVPEGFVKHMTADAVPRMRENRVFDWNNLRRLGSIGPAFREVIWKGVPDPRVPVVDAGMDGADGQTRLWIQEKYSSVNSPIPIATWKEAQLIIAEADGGQTAIDIINRLHARVDLPPYNPATDGPIAQQILEERRRELFLESHRMGDVIRFEIELEPPPGTPYPKGGVYGSTTCLPLPNRERFGNPNIPDGD